MLAKCHVKARRNERLSRVACRPPPPPPFALSRLLLESAPSETNLSLLRSADCLYGSRDGKRHLTYSVSAKRKSFRGRLASYVHHPKTGSEGKRRNPKGAPLSFQPLQKATILLRFYCCTHVYTLPLSLSVSWLAKRTSYFSVSAASVSYIVASTVYACLCASVMIHENSIVRLCLRLHFERVAKRSSNSLRPLKLQGCLRTGFGLPVRKVRQPPQLQVSQR